MEHHVNFQTFLGRKFFVALGADDAAVVDVVVVEVGHEVGYSPRRLTAATAQPIAHLAPGVNVVKLFFFSVAHEKAK
jgi:hypothetical protein